MMFGRLGIKNAFLAYDIFNLWWVYEDITPLEVEEDLYMVKLRSIKKSYRNKQTSKSRWNGPYVSSSIQQCPVVLLESSYPSEL